MDEAERAQRRRARILVVSLAVFVTMQIIAVMAANRIEAGAVRAVDVAQLIAPGLVAFGIARGMFGRPLWLRDPHALQGVNDELYLDNRRRAVEAGVVAVILVTFLVSLAAPFVGLRGFEVAHAILFALVMVPAIRFIWLERAGGFGEGSDAEQ